MSLLPKTRTAYFNGRFALETDIVIPYRDRSFNRGDGCFDMTRTFDGRIFRLEEHVERLYRSLRYLDIDIGLEPKEMIAITEQVVERNEPLRAAAGDWWVAQRISRGVDAIGDEDGDVVVLRHGKTMEVLGESNMGSSVYSTPVPANGTLFIMNRNQLYALQDSGAAKK